MEKQFTLSEFCHLIGSQIERSFPETYLVVAEISGMQIKSGHCYLELVEKSNKGNIYDARVRTICWASTYNMLSAYFANETGQTLQNGMKVLVEVEVNFHPVYGLSLIIVDINPQFTLGEMQQQRQLTIDQLRREGIFDMNKMLHLPSLPKRIAIISSPDAAGLGDFEDQLTNNPKGYRFRTTLFPAIMQGDNAAQSIISALEEIAQREEQFDLVLITRGGGSTNDLSCFDEYLLCALCAQFPLPIMTAIGHTRDVSILDQVAYIAVKTPTAAAAFLIELMDKQAEIIANAEGRVYYALNNMLQSKQQQLIYLKSMLASSFNMRIEKYRNQLEMIEHTIGLHSPQRILKQGYTLTLCDGIPMKSALKAKKGQRITTEFIDGTIHSIVE